MLARWVVYQDRMEKDNSRIGGTSFPRLHPLKAFDYLLLQAGWCPFDVQLLQQQDNNTCRYYLSQLNRRISSEDHFTCTSTECSLNAIPAEGYNSAHWTSECGPCEKLHSEASSESDPNYNLVGLRAVSSILKSGHTPLITVSWTENVHETRLKIMSSKNTKVLASLPHIYKKTGRQNQPYPT